MEYNFMINVIDEALSEQMHKRNLLLNLMDNLVKAIDNVQDIENTDILFDILEKFKSTFDVVDTNIKIYNELKSLENIENSTLYSNYQDEIHKNNSKIYEFLNYYFDCLKFTFSFPDINTVSSSEEINVENNLNGNNSEENICSNIDNKTTLEQSSNNETSSSSEVSSSNETSPSYETSSSDENSAKIEDSSTISDNKILLVSEKQGLVYLPYLISDVEKIFNSNKNMYTDLQDVINKNYIVPVSRFKNPVFSRFREAFFLMRNKENAPLPQCLDLALELSFNSLLNPAVIAACKNLDQLDIYLDYLNSNELNKFTIFEVKYEVMPIKKTSKKGF